MGAEIMSIERDEQICFHELGTFISVEHTRTTALKALDERRVSGFIEQRGRILFKRNDIERCIEFQRGLTERFKRDLKLLAPDFGN